VLVFVGLKMVLVDVYKVPIEWSLAFIGFVITASVLLLLRIRPVNKPASP
jgi:tellurite resistance protein TerC